MLRGVIFDFDGVLVDSESAHFEGFRLALSEGAGFEISLDEYQAYYLAYDDYGCIRRALERHGLAAIPWRVEAIATRKEEAFADSLSAIAFLPGAEDLVRALHEAGIPLAIASGSRRHEIEAILRAQDLLRCFRGIVGADDVGNFKPHPEPYLRGRTVLDAADSAEGLVAFEDSVPGLASARAADLRVIGVTNSFPREKLGLAHRVVDSLTELTVADVAAVAGEV